jgi:hypothetical protein
MNRKLELQSQVADTENLSAYDRDFDFARTVQYRPSFDSAKSCVPEGANRLKTSETRALTSDANYLAVGIGGDYAIIHQNTDIGWHWTEQRRSGKCGFRGANIEVE